MGILRVMKRPNSRQHMAVRNVTDKSHIRCAECSAFLQYEASAQPSRREPCAVVLLIMLSWVVCWQGSLELRSLAAMSVEVSM